MPRKAVKSSAAKPSSSQKAGGKRKRSVSADSSKPVPGLGPNKRITRSVTRRLQQEMADKMVAQNVPSPDPVQAEEGHLPSPDPLQAEEDNLPSPDPVQAEEGQPKEAEDSDHETQFSSSSVSSWEYPADEYLNATENDDENRRWRRTWLDGQSWEYEFTSIAWAKADHAIAMLVGQLVYLRASWEALTPANQKYLSSWAANAKDHLQIPASHHCLLEAWLWHILWDRLFSLECLDKWHGEQWAGYGKLCRDLRARTRLVNNNFTACFHNWRWSTTHMLWAMHGSHVDPAWLCGILRDELSGLVKKPDRVPDYEEMLLKIAESAIRLDLYIQGCKQNITLFMAHPETGKPFGFGCDALGSKEMHCPEQENKPQGILTALEKGPSTDPAGSLVDFIMRPGVKAYGNKLRIPYTSPYIRSHKREIPVGEYDQMKSDLSGGGVTETTVQKQDVVDEEEDREETQEEEEEEKGKRKEEEVEEEEGYHRRE